ncbi:hypothetical protein [Klebsiella pneumoniae]|uniref:hypothetical protein n=1 Tax=Klebsiella pneumoniae TaxID=573 RepID=UPI0035A249EE|nr:hypothetical protein [Klebsiella pneumoniae]
MNVTEIKGIFHCDCGFSWATGENGGHDCADGLREKLRQLAAENVALKALIPENWQMHDVLHQLIVARPGGVYFNKWEKLIAEALNATTATDRIVAEAEARGVEKAIVHLENKFSNIGVQIMNLQWLADSLREGAK